MKKIKSFLTCILYKLGLEKKPGPPQTAPAGEPPRYAGPQVISTANAVFVHHNDNAALVVDYEFSDVPSWVEWDMELNKLVIAQMGGDLTELNTEINEQYLEDYKGRKKLFLISNHKGDKIIHQLSFIARKK